MTRLPFKIMKKLIATTLIIIAASSLFLSGRVIYGDYQKQVEIAKYDAVTARIKESHRAEAQVYVDELRQTNPEATQLRAEILHDFAQLTREHLAESEKRARNRPR